jgi:hypothetical protein
MAPLGNGRRRTPGRRREEVAAAAGMSVDYCSRLEQARGPHPSVSVLNGVARALELDADERAHLFRLARPLVEEMMASPLFARLWAEHDVAMRRSARERLRHPVLGLLEFDCEVLGAPEHDQWLVIHVAPEGSVTEQRLALLATADEAAGRMPEPWTLVPVSPSSE